MAARSPGGGWTRARPPARASSEHPRPRPPRSVLAALAALVGAALLAAPATARADDAQALETARSPFDNGQYLEAHTRLATLLDPSLPPCDAASGAPATPATLAAPTPRCRLTAPDLVERARALDAASLLALKRDPEADALIAVILRQNPNYLPSPALFPQEVIDRFNTVRGSLSVELRAIAQKQAQDAEQKRLAQQQEHDDAEAWIAEVQRLAARERSVETHSRFIALVPFGIGQLQNGDVRLGITFAVGEALLGGASLVTVAIVDKLASTNLRPVGTLPVDLTGLNAELSTATTVNRATFSAWAALTLAGVIQAQVAFVPEKVTYRDRPIPPRPKLVPLATPVARGAVLGVGGTF